MGWDAQMVYCGLLRLHCGSVAVAKPLRCGFLRELCSHRNCDPLPLRCRSHLQYCGHNRYCGPQFKSLLVPIIMMIEPNDGNGTNGMAIFKFDQPSVFNSSGEVGDITGFYMIDEEGDLQSVDVSAKFANGKPAVIEAKYVMRSPSDWDRFMRFMERYSNADGLQFIEN